MTQIRWQPETTTTTPVVLEVNGERHALEVPGDRKLVDVLRDDLGLTGTKVACAEGACGACAVLIDGEPVASCIYPAAKAEGHVITTIEGISAEGLTALQEAFVAEDALQCGFCTPGQIVSATALLAENPSPTPEEIRVAMAGNLCRCGAYQKIEKAVLRAAESLR
jgi:aerobic-type carbon monoxide dehydrogenase small subunit (CoxS/CutS family)